MVLFSVSTLWLYLATGYEDTIQTKLKSFLLSINCYLVFVTLTLISFAAQSLYANWDTFFESDVPESSDESVEMDMKVSAKLDGSIIIEAILCLYVMFPLGKIFIRFLNPQTEKFFFTLHEDKEKFEWQP